MVKVKFDNQKQEWIVLPPYSKEGFYLDGKLKEKLDSIKKIQKKGFDSIILIDGDRRTGKSILGITCGWYLSNEKLTINNFAIGSAHASQKIKELPNRSVLFVDEGSTIFNSKDAMQKELKQLIKIIDVCGQKEIAMIIVLPSYFDLIKPIAIRCSRFLLHVYTDPQMNRGSFAYFGKRRKHRLYIIGKKNFDSYNSPKSDFRGKFVKFEPPFYDNYIAFKRRTLNKILDNKPTPVPPEIKLEWRREILKNNLENEDKLTNKQLAMLFHVTERTIYTELNKIKEDKEKTQISL